MPLSIDILEWIKSLPSAIVDGISSVLTSIFVPSTDFITAKVESLRARFDWIDPFIVFAENISGELFSTEPPVIYIHLDDAEGNYNYGGTIPFLDMRWYARYKKQGDLILSGFLWALFAWRMYLKLPASCSGICKSAIVTALASSGSVCGNTAMTSAGYKSDDRRHGSPASSLPLITLTAPVGTRPCCS